MSFALQTENLSKIFGRGKILPGEMLCYNSFWKVT